MISYQRTRDLVKSAALTYRNMSPYYQALSVDWDQEKILEQISDLENWDILYNGEIIGAVRLAMDAQGCYLRDLQVSEQMQNNGIGAHALLHAKELAQAYGAETLRLRVLKISPAYHLYKRQGFSVSDEDERFYYMEIICD